VNSDEVAAVRSIFDVPHQYVYHLMRTDSFGRFVLSSSYKDLLASKTPSLWKAARKSVRPSISAEIRNFGAEFKDDVTIKSLLDKKQDLRMKKPDWKPRINLGRTTGHARATKQQPTQTVELSPTESRDLDSSPPNSSRPHTQIQITTDFDEGSSSRKVRSDSQEMLILPGLDTLPVLREGGTPRDSKDKELEDKSIVDHDIKRMIASASTVSSLPTLPNLNLSTILGRDKKTQRTEIPTKQQQHRKLGTTFFAPLQTNRRGSM